MLLTTIMTEEKNFYETYKHGQYYNPARLHYPGAASGDVGCDRCLKEDLTACIGWKDIDLCLQCISIIDEKYNDGDLIIYDSSSDSDY